MAFPYKSLSRKSKRFKKIKNNKIKEKKNILANQPLACGVKL